jgi:soluble lytic murein transglycosylase-like protein
MGAPKEGGMNELTGIKGPQGVEERMREIQGKLDSMFGSSFQNQLASATAGLHGDIGGEQPMNPFGQGKSICGQASPELKQMISEAAKQHGVDENIFDALVSTESAYNSGARSRAGALGLCQLMPGTAQSLGISNALDPQQNLNGGAKYLGQLMNQFGDPRLALAAYNAGPNAVVKAGNQIPPYPETQAYVNKIMGLVNARRTP